MRGMRSASPPNGRSPQGRIHRSSVPVKARVASLAYGGGVAWACSAGPGDPGGTTGTTGTTWTARARPPVQLRRARRPSLVSLHVAQPLASRREGEIAQLVEHTTE